MKGTTVTLYELVQTGEDAFGVPTYSETPVEVEDVLVGEPNTDDIATSTALYQKVIRFMLGKSSSDTDIRLAEARLKRSLIRQSVAAYKPK